MATTVPPVGAVAVPPVTGYAVYSATNYYSGDSANAVQKYSYLDYQLSTINTNATALQSRVASAEQKEMADFTILSSSIASEATRAQTAESSVASSVVAEATRATSAEAVLRASIVTEKALREDADASIASSVLAERNRAIASEAGLSSSIVAVQADVSALQAGLAQAVAKEIADQAQLVAVDALIKTAINSVVDGESSLWNAVQMKASIQATNDVYATFKNFLDVFFAQYSISQNGAPLSASNFIPSSYPLSMPTASVPLPHPFP
jgi:hypothetical protein